MTDRELLDLAAKAAGQPIVWLQDDPETDWVTGESPSIPNRYVLEKWNWESWNPLANDGDALRLAVTLNMACAPGVASWKDDHGQQHTIREINTDFAATRRAIARAAAEIGRSIA